MKKILIATISTVLLLLVGCSSTSSKETFDNFKKGLDTSAQIQTFEQKYGGKTVYYYQDEKNYGFKTDSITLNCSEDQELTTEAQEACEYSKNNFDKYYNSTFKVFFSEEYDAKYKSEDKYYEVNGEYETGGKYSIKIYKDGKKVAWKDDDMNYKIELVDKVEIPKTVLE